MSKKKTVSVFITGWKAAKSDYFKVGWFFSMPTRCQKSPPMLINRALFERTDIFYGIWKLIGHYWGHLFNPTAITNVQLMYAQWLENAHNALWELCNEWTATSRQMAATTAESSIHSFYKELIHGIQHIITLVKKKKKNCKLIIKLFN